MSETPGEDDDQQRLDSVAEKIREGHEAAGELADRNVIDPDVRAPTQGVGEDVAPEDTPDGTPDDRS